MSAGNPWYLQIYFFFKNKLNTNGDLMGSQRKKKEQLAAMKQT